MALVVASLDFGTTFSGWAYQTMHDFKTNPNNVFAKVWYSAEPISSKTSTCLLLKPNGKEIESFGYDAERRYAELAEREEHARWFFFRRFKMMLYGKKIQRSTKIKDETGKPMEAFKVFVHSIKFLRDDFLEAFKKTVTTYDENHIHWVLTVPAIWNDDAKQFMREAAQEAGIPGDNLTIALEPEAASLYCRTLPVELSMTSLSSFGEGDKYLVIDAGGGTVDISAHEIIDGGNLKELHKASGGPWGGTVVDKAFERFIDEITGEGVFEAFKQAAMEDYLDFVSDFEKKKRSKPTIPITIQFPVGIKQITKQLLRRSIEETISKSKYNQHLEYKSKQNKLRIQPEVIASMFEEPNKYIVEHVKQLLKEPNLRGCKAIVMVGGFSESPILQHAIKDNFQNLKTIIPNEAGLSVLKGAAVFGHNPKAITERMCKYTYGIRNSHIYDRERCEHRVGQRKLDENGKMRCYDMFSIHAKSGQTVRLSEELSPLTYCPITDEQITISLDVYRSTHIEPQLVTDPSCEKIGFLEVPLPDKLLDQRRSLSISFLFGGTEIIVKVTVRATGETKELRIDFLK